MYKTKEDKEFEAFIDWITTNTSRNLDKEYKEKLKLQKALDKSAGLKRIGAFTFTSIKKRA